MLLAVRPILSPAETEEFARIVEGREGVVDWEEFLLVTFTHRLGTLVLQGLDNHPDPGIPQSVLESLRLRKEANTLRAVRSSLEIQRISRHCERAGFPLLTLKGTPLSEVLYGNLATRHVGDLDLLTLSQNLVQPIELFSELGYVLVNPPCRITPRRLASYRRFWKDFTFRHESTGFMVDLHWRLFNNRFHPANRLVESTDTTVVSVFSLPLHTLSLVDQLLYSAVHGASDAWIYFKSLADIAAFLHRLTPLEFEFALHRAKALRLSPQLSSAVHMAREWMGATIDHPLLLPPSDPFHQAIRQRTVDTLRRNLYRPQRSNPGPLAAITLELELVPGTRSLAEIASRFLWRPRVWSTIDLPDTFFWTYPLLGLFLPPRPPEAPLPTGTA